MITLYIIGGVIVAILLILFIPLKVKIKFCVKTNENNTNENMYLDNYVKIYILRIIRLKKIRINERSKTSSDKNNKSKEVLNDILNLINKFVNYEKKDELFVKPKDIVKVKNSITYNQFYLDIGFNFKEVIINAYVIAILNTLINLYISKNAEIFNFKKTEYNTYISNKVFDIHFYSIINLNLVHTIIVLIKLIIDLRKVAKKNGKRTSN